MIIIIIYIGDNIMKKTITFAILHFSVAFMVAYVLTGSILIGGAMALIEPAINTVVFFFHEKAWQRWGKQPSSDELVSSTKSESSAQTSSVMNIFCHHGLTH